jgi:hypothetical protein
MGSRIIFLIAFLMLVPDALSASRGISVQLRASESKNAELVGEYRMYNESYALVVGIDEYTEGWPKLSNAVKDAELIAEALEEKGFEVDLHKNLDSAELMQVFKRFFILKGERPDARLFVWFAGHGATVDGEGYLVPANAPVISEGASFKFSSLALRDFGTYMRQSSSKHVYAVFDSCFAGTVFSAQRAMPPAAITRATALPVRQFLTSGDADQTVSDDGQFRELFIRAIRGEERSDANADGYLTASELGMYLGDRVTNLTESAQTPRYGKLRDRDFDRGDFVFALPTAPVTGSDESSRGNEIVFWNLIKDTGSSSEYAAYLSQFPNGQFASQALTRQQQLQQSASLNLSREEFLQQGYFDFKPINRDLVTVEQTTVRAVPNMQSTIVGQLAAGTNVWGLGEYKGLSGDWFDISHSGVRLGFVSVDQLQSIEQTDRFVEIDKSGKKSDSSRLDDQLSQMMYGLLDEPVTPDSTLAVNESGNAKSSETLSAGVELVREPEAGEGISDDLKTITGLAQNDDLTVVEAEYEDVPGASNEAAKEGSLAALPSGKGTLTEVGKDTLGGADSTVAVTQDGDEDPGEALLTTSNEGMAADSNGPVVVDSVIQPEPKIGDMATATTDSVKNLPAEVTTTQQPDAIDAVIDIADKDASKGVPQELVQEQGLNAQQPPSDAASESEVLALASAHDEVGSSSTARAQLSVSEQQRDFPDLSLPEKEAVAAANKQEVVGVSGQQEAVSVGQATAAELEPGGDAAVQVAQEVTVDKEATASAEESLGLYARRYLNAALKGNIDAQFYLGYMYENGEHVTKDVLSAKKWYRRAAEMEHINAMIRLASLLDEDPEATHWFRKAAEKGDAGAQAMIAFRYESGTGTPIDLEEAVIWYKRAAEQNQIVSQVNLGRLYQLGIGVEKNLDQAIFWYEKAAKQGNEAAQNNLQQLLPDLN